MHFQNLSFLKNASRSLTLQSSSPAKKNNRLWAVIPPLTFITRSHVIIDKIGTQRSGQHCSQFHLSTILLPHNGYGNDIFANHTES